MPPTIENCETFKAWGDTSGIGVGNFEVANTCVGAENGPNVAGSGGNGSLSATVIGGLACLSDLRLLAQMQSFDANPQAIPFPPYFSSYSP